ncbi:protein eva-1 homolog C isoform X2 [Genypterus blacodes]|uniref:protein eva-1 homolog C isoform X2 n=1 Tax=Genypterus blacodes TaxID=154954 RepID=UPI003F76B18A
MSRTLQWSRGLFYLTVLLWTRRLSGLADFSNYLSRIISSHSAQACDGQPLRLHCPRHSTISIQAAFYGSGRVHTHRTHNHTCSALTAVQKLLSECQSHRSCQLPVSPLLFGKDPCPGTNKYLHVDYKCKPTEHRSQVACEGGALVLRCKTPRVLNIYAAVYGRSLGDADTCPSPRTRPPPFECLNHDAVHTVTKSCYGRQRCAVAVGDQTFRDPCFPGTRKYLSVLYACVPQALLKEADPSMFSSTSAPPVESDKGDVEEELFPEGSRRPDKSGAVMSDSLLIYGFIKERPEMAALLFTSSVCVGLLLMLLAVSVRVTCRRHSPGDHRLTAKSPSPTVEEDEDDYEEDDDDDEEGTGSSLLSATDRKAILSWEEVTYVSEAAERAERMERREMIVQEIWMNGYLNVNATEL